MMKLLFRCLVILGVSSAAQIAHGQNILADLGGSTYREKVVFAVYDLPGADLKTEAIESAVHEAIRLYARDARIRQGIPPSPYPELPAQMTLGKRIDGGPKPDCAGEVFSIEGIDTTMLKYGESTYHRACLFPYAGGYRLNYFAMYGQKSGAANPNGLSAMLGRAIGSVVGVGDSSVAINKLMGKLESNLEGIGISHKLVQLHPKDVGGRVAAPDELAKAQKPGAMPVPPTAQAPAPQPVNIAGPAPAQPTGQADMPPQLAQLKAMLTQDREARRQQAAPPNGGSSSTSKPTPTEARKELTGMGLQYFSQDQFEAAIRRGDVLAVDLFIAGAGVDLNGGGTGSTPLAIAESAGKDDIAGILRKAGARR